MTQQIILNIHNQKTDQVDIVVGNECSNTLPTTICEIDAMDLLGLSWLLVDDEFSIDRYQRNLI